MTAHATHQMHENSLEAFRTLPRQGRQAAILAVYAGGAWLTDREVAERLGCTDMNAVRPRISELVDDKVLAEVGTAKDHATGRPVRICAVNP